MAKTTSDGHLKFIKTITDEDAAGLIKAHESYGDSWKKRGGVGAYMVMIRKFDRMERAARKNGWDIFEAVRNDPRVEGILDDLRDARRYLVLIESVLREMGLVEGGNHRDNVPEGGVGMNAHMGLRHQPDAACDCARCLVMRAVANKPHRLGCKCLDCRGPQTAEEAARRGETHAEVTGIVQDQLKAEAAAESCSPECSHPDCKKAREEQL